MGHADPWDEAARLEWEMEVELLARLERSPSKEVEGLPAGERAPVDRAHLDPPL